MKKWIVLIVAIMICFCLAGYFLINKNDDYCFWPEAIKSKTVLMNKFFGIQLTIPKGWYLISLNENNFNKGGVDTKEELSLHAYYDSNQNGTHVDLAVLYNVKEEASLNHVEVDVFAEKLNMTFNEYLQSIVDYAVSKVGGYPDEFLKESSALIKGISYRTLHFQSAREEDRYLTDYYICERQGYYLCMRFVYWAENTDAEKEITSYMNENVTWH